MSGFNYMDCYFEFQREFKPVEYYPSLDKIVESALTKLVKVLECYSNEKFVQNIKLVYPNYFTEKKDHCFEPIKDDLICFNNPDEELKERVLQHMSYYMTGKDTKFMRISKTLLENEKLNIKNFLVKKANNNYEVSINGELKKTKLCKPSQQFPVEIEDSLIKGSFTETKSSVKDELTICQFSAAKGEQEASPEDLPEKFKERGINDVEDFVQIFESPLSAHYIMLQKASLLYVYSQTAQIDKNKSSLGYGGMFVLISSGLEESKIGKYICFFQLVSDYISICIAHNIMRAKQKREAEKSAKAAIMSRNMSHNLGSHVMSYLKQYLGDITSILNTDSRVLYNLIDGGTLNKSIKSKNSDFGKIKSKIQLPFLVGTGRFIGYLQERQDYIATIATDYIPYGAPVNMKDAIYDELNPDLRYMRHNSKDNNKPMNVLLNFIAKSEGLSRENMGVEWNTMSLKSKKEIPNAKYKTKNDILFGYIKHTDSSVKEIFGLQYDKNDSKNEALEEMRKVNFSMPGGLVGRQALFSIIENLIRNAAKHGDTSSINNLSFTFDVIELHDIQKCKDIENRISDSKWRWLYSNSSDKDNLYLLTITDNLVYKSEVSEAIKASLVEGYVDDRSLIMLTGNKGIKEIRISSAWLRNETDERKYFQYADAPDLSKQNMAICTKSKKAPLVGVELTKEGHLRYMISIMRDNFAAVLMDETMSQEDKTFFSLMANINKLDWKIYHSINEAIDDFKNTYHYIVVGNKDSYNKLRPFTSNRLRIWSPNEEERKELLSSWEGLSADKLEQEYAKQKNFIIKNLCQIKDDDDKIYIWDGAAFLAHNPKEISKHIVVSTSDSHVKTAKYVYRTHHSSKEDFTKYWEKKKNGTAYGKVRCIDAVTGDNSSDRIVRREPLDDEWYFNHLNALRKKVAIFDERLSKIVNDVDEGDLQINNIDYDLVVELLNELNQSGVDYKSIKAKIQKNQKLSTEFRQDVNLVNSKEELIEKLIHPIDKDNYKSIVFKEKGIDVFTIIEKSNGVFSVIGYTGSPSEFSEINSITGCRYAEIATISLVTGKDFNIEIKLNDNWKNKYDYISIHQGILDKLYEGFGIKPYNNGNNDASKIKVTNAIYESFMREGKEPHTDFLPCFIIHSGRAKPTKEDMPQKLPFIQYSAIEHGVLDCKYSLIEVLDYARYEQMK